MTTDRDRLGAIRGRLEAATPAPWRHGYGDESGQADGKDGATITALYDVPEGDLIGETVVNGGHDDWGTRTGVKRAEDAELIAHAPDDLAYLLGLVEELMQRERDSWASEGFLDD